MHLLTVLGLAVSSNLDTLGVGLAYGSRKYRLPFLSNLICAVIPCVGTFATMIVGSAVRRIIISQLANILGASIIMVAGLVLIVQHIRRRRKQVDAHSHARYRAHSDSPTAARLLIRELGRILEDPFSVDYDYSGSIETKEAVVLAFALTLNNLSAGFAAGLLGLDVFLIVGSSFILSLVLFYTGIKIGLMFLARWFGENGALAAGVILILLGIYEIVT